MSKKIIAIGSDHAGFRMKEEIKNFLLENGYQVKDVGAFSDERADYPDFAHAVAREIGSGQAEKGILLCGSGNGINMAVNKHAHIRSALCWNEEIAKLAREHNDANVLALPSRFVSGKQAINMAEVFLNTEFEGGRHEQRVKKISC